MWLYILIVYISVFCRNNVPIVLEDENDEEERKEMMEKEENGQTQSGLNDKYVAVWPQILLQYILTRATIIPISLQFE